MSGGDGSATCGAPQPAAVGRAPSPSTGGPPRSPIAAAASAWQDAERLLAALEDLPGGEVDFHALLRLMRTEPATPEGQALLSTSVTLFAAMDRSGTGRLPRSELRAALAAALSSHVASVSHTATAAGHAAPRRHARAAQPAREPAREPAYEPAWGLDAEHVQPPHGEMAASPPAASASLPPVAAAASSEATPLPSSRSDGSLIYDAIWYDGVLYGTSRRGVPVAATFDDGSATDEREEEEEEEAEAAEEAEEAAGVHGETPSDHDLPGTSPVEACAGMVSSPHDGSARARPGSDHASSARRARVHSPPSPRNAQRGSAQCGSAPARRSPSAGGSSEPSSAQCTPGTKGLATPKAERMPPPPVTYNLTHLSPGSACNGIGAQRQRTAHSPTNGDGHHGNGNGWGASPLEGPPAPTHRIIFRNQSRSRHGGSPSRAAPPMPRAVHFYLRTRGSSVRFPFPPSVDERAVLHVAKAVESADGPRGAPADSEPQALVSLDPASVVGLEYAGQPLPSLFVTVPSGWSPRQQRYVNRDLEPTELCVNLSDPRAHRGERKDPHAAADEGGPQCTVVHVRTVTSAPGGRAAGASATNAAGPGGGGGGPAAAERRALTRVY